MKEALMPTIRLGHKDGHITVAHIPDHESWTDDERFYSVIDDGSGTRQGIWATHRAISESDIPAWLESDDPDFAYRIAMHYGCPVGAPASEFSS